MTNKLQASDPPFEYGRRTSYTMGFIRSLKRGNQEVGEDNTFYCSMKTKILSWNIRGVNRDDKKSLVRS